MGRVLSLLLLHLGQNLHGSCSVVVVSWQLTAIALPRSVLLLVHSKSDLLFEHEGLLRCHGRYVSRASAYKLVLLHLVSWLIKLSLMWLLGVQATVAKNKMIYSIDSLTSLGIQEGFLHR